MIGRIPIIAAGLSHGDLLSSYLAGNDSLTEFREGLRKASGVSGCTLFNSGAAALYAALLCLKQKSGRDEVLIPAYTAVSVAISAKKAGLKVRLCDINMMDLGFDVDLLAKESGGNTLAAVPVNLFGYKSEFDFAFRAIKNSGAYIVEDCAQSFLLEGGWMPDVAILSFNRGKNLTALGGGAAIYEDLPLFAGLPDVSELTVKRGSKLKMHAFLLTKNTAIYGLLHKLAAKFKESTFENDFPAGGINPVNAALGVIALERYKEWKEKRRKNAAYFSEAFSGLKGARVIGMTAFSVPNRLPVIVEDSGRRDRVIANLSAAGIDASAMYQKPVHHWLDLGYGENEFPNAVSLAKSLVTLPVHPLLSQKQLEHIVKEFKKCFL